MVTQQAHADAPPKSTERDDLSQTLDAIGWGLFFIWIGIGFLIDVGWGWGLLGVGIIILGETVARWFLGLKIEGFWVVCGLAFFIGGIWELFQVPWPLVPILLILCGLAVVWGAVSGKHIMRK